MRDTSPEMEQKMWEMIQQKTPIERLRMGFSMYETSKFLVSQYIRQHFPNLTEPEFQVMLFLKFYEDDFSPEALEKIIQHILKQTSASTKTECD